MRPRRRVETGQEHLQAQRNGQCYLLLTNLWMEFTSPIHNEIGGKRTCCGFQRAAGFTVLFASGSARHCCWQRNFQLSTRIAHNLLELFICWINEVNTTQFSCIVKLRFFDSTLPTYLSKILATKCLVWRSFVFLSVSLRTMYFHLVVFHQYGESWVCWALKNCERRNHPRTFCFLLCGSVACVEFFWCFSSARHLRATLFFCCKIETSRNETGRDKTRQDKYKFIHIHLHIHIHIHIQIRVPFHWNHGELFKCNRTHMQDLAATPMWDKHRQMTRNPKKRAWKTLKKHKENGWQT